MRAICRERKNDVQELRLRSLRQTRWLLQHRYHQSIFSYEMEWRSNSISSKDTGSSFGSKWVKTLLSGRASTIARSISSHNACPLETVHFPGTNTWKEIKRHEPAALLRSA